MYIFLYIETTPNCTAISIIVQYVGTIAAEVIAELVIGTVFRKLSRRDKLALKWYLRPLILPA